MDMEQVICSCLGVTAGMIKEAVDNGASTVEEVSEATGAGTVCGVCMEEVGQLVEQFLEEKQRLT